MTTKNKKPVNVTLPQLTLSTHVQITKDGGETLDWDDTYAFNRAGIWVEEYEGVPEWTALSFTCGITKVRITLPPTDALQLAKALLARVERAY